MQPHYVNNDKYFSEITDYVENKQNLVIVCQDEKNKYSIVKQFSRLLLNNNIKIFTLKDLQDSVFLTGQADGKNLALIAEDKREFAFYQTFLECPKSLQDVFDIKSYFQSIKQAQDFYYLFEEINNFTLDEQIVKQTLSNSAQQEPFENLCLIKENLKKFLTKRGLTDKIFVENIDTFKTNINNLFCLFNDCENVLFLDTYATNRLTSNLYSNLLSYLSTNKTTCKNVDIITTFKQGQINLNDFTLNLKEDNSYIYKLIDKFNIENIDIFKATNDLDLYMKISAILDKTQTNLVVDFDNNKDKIYPLLLNDDKFNTKKSLKMIDSCLYVYFDMMYKLLNSARVTANRVTLLDIAIFYDCINTDDFIGKYLDNKSTNILRKIVSSLIGDKSYIYIDIEFDDIKNEVNEIEQKQNADKSNTCKKLIDGLNKLTFDITNLLAIKNIGQLKNYIETDIIKQEHFYKEKNTTVFDLYFTAIEDILTTENVNIVNKDDWSKFFNHQQFYGVNFIKFLLDYLKSKSINLDQNVNQSKLINFQPINSYDEHSKNDSIFLINLNNSVFPNVIMKNKFFSESQRNCLGLYNQDYQICLQKIMFKNILANNKNISIIYIEDEATDQFGSGLVDEVKFFCQSNNINHTFFDTKVDKNIDTYSDDFNDKYNILLNNILDNKDNSVQINRELQDYTLDFNTDDFKNNTLNISYSGLDTLSSEPEQYYLEKVIGLKKVEINRVPTIDDLLLGNIVHAIYSDLLQFDEPICLADLSPLDLNKINLNEKSQNEMQNRLNKNIKNLYNKYKNSNLFKVPDDFNKDFLKDIIFPFIIKQFNKFIDILRDEFGDNAIVKFIPEKDYEEDDANKKDFKPITGEEIIKSLDFEKGSDNQKELDSIKETLSKLSFKLSGRADLQIEVGNQNVIIDYKTGRSINTCPTQLYIYQLMYYEDKQSCAYFFMIFDCGRLTPNKQNADINIKSSVNKKIYDAIKPILIKNKWARK